MTAKEYLQQVHKINIKIGQRVTQLDEMRHRIKTVGSFDYSRDRVQSSPESGNRQIEDLVDLEREIESLIIREQRMKDRIISEIQTLTDPNHVDILFRRYIDCQAFERIACDMGYAYNYVLHIHGDALKEFTNKVLTK